MTDQTEKEFSKHVGTKFQTTIDEREIQLELTEVKGYSSAENEEQGMERFSLFFMGPVDIKLPQQTFQMQHEKMGEIFLFLVPISMNEKGFRYEAVFNYFKPLAVD
jgi:uncharacterized protein DUF6916